jgi:hypothetical protein
MASSDRPAVARASMATLDALQDFAPDTQVAAMALVFARACRQAGLRPVEVLQITNNIFTDGERVSPEFRAIDSYLAGERIV